MCPMNALHDYRTGFPFLAYSISSSNVSTTKPFFGAPHKVHGAPLACTLHGIHSGPHATITFILLRVFTSLESNKAFLLERKG